MKILDQFILENNNKPLEVYDPSNKNQCVDLVLGWLKKLGLGNLIPLGIVNAYQLYNPSTPALKAHFDIITNSPTAVPQAGDIVVWSSAYGPAGHTAVATGKGDTKSFEAFSQNDPTGKPCILKTYTYAKVLGWLRPKVLPVEQPDMSDQDKKDIESMNNLRAYNNVWYESKYIIADYEARVAEIRLLQNEVSSLNKRINELEGDISLSADSIESLEMELNTIQVGHAEKMKTLIDKYEKDIATIKKNRKPVKVVRSIHEMFKGKSFASKMKGIQDILSA